MARLVAATLTNGWPSYVAVPTATAKVGDRRRPGHRAEDPDHLGPLDGVGAGENLEHALEPRGRP